MDRSQRRAQSADVMRSNAAQSQSKRSPKKKQSTTRAAKPHVEVSTFAFDGREQDPTARRWFWPEQPMEKKSISERVRLDRDGSIGSFGRLTNRSVSTIRSRPDVDLESVSMFVDRLSNCYDLPIPPKLVQEMQHTQRKVIQENQAKQKVAIEKALKYRENLNESLHHRKQNRIELERKSHSPYRLLSDSLGETELIMPTRQSTLPNTARSMESTIFEYAQPPPPKKWERGYKHTNKSPANESEGVAMETMMEIDKFMETLKPAGRLHMGTNLWL